MTLPTPARWTDPRWRDDALAWAVDTLTADGRVVESWTQPHVRPWSTVLRLQTADGPVWLKAPCDGTRYEVALLALLAELDAPGTPRPIATDVGRGLVLLPDDGPTSRAAHDGATPPEQVIAYLPAYAALQRSLEPHVPRLLAVGVPDLRPQASPGLLERTADRYRRLPAPARLEAADAERVRAAMPAYADACAELAASGIAATLQHDDLHDANVLADGPVFVDWGDASVAHPFSTLLATLNSMAAHHHLAQDDPVLLRAADAYTEAWSDVCDLTTRRRLVHLAQRVGVLGKSLAYSRALQGADDEALTEYGEAMPGWLLELFADDLPLAPPPLVRPRASRGAHGR